MLVYNGKPVMEGIDCIVLQFEDKITNFIDFNKQIDPRNRIKIKRKVSSFLSDGEIYHKGHGSLYIFGEYINHELPIKITIANAIHLLFLKNIIRIPNGEYKGVFSEISTDVICDNLFLFISGIKRIEFCFDFQRDWVRIADGANILRTTDTDFPSYIATKLRDRRRRLIQIDTTCYSYDYKGNKVRKSFIKLYDREKHLLEKGNEYSKKEILEYPYKMRIEFTLVKYKNSPYLAFENMEGNYNEIIKRYIPYLASLYKKYFLDMIITVPFNHHNFYFIWYIAHHDRISRNKSLVNMKNSKVTNKNEKLSELYSLLEKEERRRNQILKNIPDSYYAGFNDIKNLMEKQGITPFDMDNDDKILFKDDEFTFFKNNVFLPKYNNIENEDEK